MLKKLSLGDYVEFRYCNGKNVRSVKGWVGEITRNSISVGNEQLCERKGVFVEHTKKYTWSKIEKMSVE